MTFSFGFCSVLYGEDSVRFGFLHIFTYWFRFGSVLGKTWVLVRFVLPGSGSFPSLFEISYFAVYVQIKL